MSQEEAPDVQARLEFEANRPRGLGGPTIRELLALADQIETETLRRRGPTSEEYWAYRCLTTLGRTAEEHQRLLVGQRRNTEFGLEWAEAVLALFSLANMYLEPDAMAEAFAMAPEAFRQRSETGPER